MNMKVMMLEGLPRLRRRSISTQNQQLAMTPVAGTDVCNNFTPAVNDVTFSILLVLKLIKNWEARLIGIENAFLHRGMEEQICMNLPEGPNLYEGAEKNNETECMILDRCIYGTV